jgi:fatty-acyl-CoA synthase
VRQHDCTYFNYVGRALSYILAVPETPDDRDNDLQWCLGSEASPRDRREFRRRFGCVVVEGYSSSEGAVVIQPFAGMPPDALGRPNEGTDVAVIDPETGIECPRATFDDDHVLSNPGAAIGEIVGRDGLSSFEGYYANPAADAERGRDGWYWTGDLGYRDEAGTFYFAGRTADWLRVDGENFAAGTVERILGRLPEAAAVVVYAVPDPGTGDQVMAALELQPGATFDPAAFAGFLAAQPDLGTKWAPRFVRVVEQIPSTATGKVDRQPLRTERWDTVDPVWWRPSAVAPYRRFTADDAADLRRAFADAGRAGVLT